MTTLTVTAAVTKRCPYKDEQDDGTATLTFDVSECDGPELHALADQLAQYRHLVISHEEFTRLLVSLDDCVSARTTWTTAGMTVECSHP